MTLINAARSDSPRNVVRLGGSDENPARLRKSSNGIKVASFAKGAGVVGLGSLSLIPIFGVPFVLTFIGATFVLVAHVAAHKSREIVSALPLLVLPLLFVLSTLWSVDRSETFRSSIQYVVSFVFAVCLARSFSLKTIVTMIVISLIPAVLISYFDLPSALAQQRAAQGFYSSKNLLGIVSGLLFVSSLIIVLDNNFKKVPRLLASLSGLIALAPLILADSSGANLSTASAVAVLVVATAYRASTLLLRCALVVCLISSFPIAVVGVPVVKDAWNNFQTDILKKDQTLTGRTQIWYVADQIAAEKPILGRGYQAFWIQGSPDAEGIWRTFGIENRTGFNFHNDFWELRVDLGWVGVIMFSSILGLATLGHLIRLLMGAPGSVVAAASLMTFICARVFVETSLVYQFHLQSVCFVILAVIGVLGEPVFQTGPDRKRKTRFAEKPHLPTLPST